MPSLHIHRAAAAAAFITLLTAAAHGQIQPLASGLKKLTATEPTTSTTYVRIFLDGILVPLNSPSDAAPLPLTPSTTPVLIAQCTRTPEGKLAFELHAHYGGVDDTAFYPPWHSTPDDLYPPETEKVTIAMDFFGYTKVKPAKRQWEYLIAPAGELRYNPPGARSRNLEAIAFYLQYLRALPTLRLSTPDKASQFNTAPLLDAIRKEPLCRASGIQ